MSADKEALSMATWKFWIFGKERPAYREGILWFFVPLLDAKGVGARSDGFLGDGGESRSTHPTAESTALANSRRCHVPDEARNIHSRWSMSSYKGE